MIFLIPQISPSIGKRLGGDSLRSLRGRRLVTPSEAEGGRSRTATGGIGSPGSPGAPAEGILF